MKKILILTALIGLTFLAEANPNGQSKLATNTTLLKINNQNIINENLFRLALLQYEEPCGDFIGSGTITYWIVYDESTGQIISSGAINNCTLGGIA